jgi:hypothetical protein
MQAAPPPAVRLHWIPVEPSWLVAVGLVLLAALPHQIPATGRRVLTHPVGALLFAAIAAVVWWSHPVLGTAMFLLVAALRLRPTTEGFAPQILIKDRVRPKGPRWHQEEVMMEEPTMIQERTADSGGFILDRVSEEEAKPWFVESTLEENPAAIQERPVRPADPSETDYETGGRAGIQ